jgi:RNA polymerase sigma-70 factor, ECF subfamily
MQLSGCIRLAVLASAERAPADGETFGVMAVAESYMDEGTFREFYNEVAPSLRAYILRACGDSALADDLLQEAFYRLLRANLPVLERWQLKAYLYRTASSLLTDRWRRIKRERRWRLERLMDEAKSAEEVNEQGRAMWVFRRLKPREQTLLWLAYVEGFDHREIALALQLSEKSIRVLLFRARKNFGAVLRKEGFGILIGKL